MYRNGYIEKMGTGTEDIIRKCRAQGLRTPEFRQDGDFIVTIWRKEKARRTKKTQKSPEASAESFMALINLIKKNPAITRKELAEALNVDIAQVRKDIEVLRAEGKLSHEGPSRGGRWLLSGI